MSDSTTPRKKPGPKPVGGKLRVQVSTWTDANTAEQIQLWTALSAILFPNWTTGRTLELMTQICQRSAEKPIAGRCNKKAGRASTPMPAPKTSPQSKTQNGNPVNQS